MMIILIIYDCGCVLHYYSLGPGKIPLRTIACFSHEISTMPRIIFHHIISHIHHQYHVAMTKHQSSTIYHLGRQGRWGYHDCGTGMTDSEPNGDMLDLKPKWPDWLSWWLQLRQIQPDVHQQPSTIIINQHTQSKPKALHHLAPQGDAAKKALLQAFEPSLHHASFPWCLWLWQPHTRQQVFEGLVHKSPTFATVRLLTGIDIGCAFQPIALAIQPIFIEALKKPPVLAWSIYRHPQWSMAH